ncbi:guanine nucleotide exchange factor for Rab-3A isoform X6 [Dromiciops gliroides]|uniref:guanine nucleotide exchange factor for Rab-3A isoform X6 n=1 Tax=Dromiciops gliroides TaxID=33562 RepID=UPI001CC40CF1|nr:guanine nucleotide exchange factor for Rab-3A isoform X6 [Dromiciops gliroides]
MEFEEEYHRCPARAAAPGTCPLLFAVSTGTVQYVPRLDPGATGASGVALDPAPRLDTAQEDPCQMDSQPQAEEGGQPSPVTSSWKSSSPCKGRRETQLLEPPCGEGGRGEEAHPANPLDVSRLRSSSVEIREKGSEFLKEELRKAQKELKLKDEECERLSKVREQLEQELEELTASLFEEAHKMVREANTKQAASEKQLMEARGKIDMLQAEVTALKALVITSTPSSPNRELHPQLLSPSKAVFRKGHARNKSTSSTLCPAVCPATGHSISFEPIGHECKEVDTVLFAEFQAWKEAPTLDKSCPFLERIYREDVGPCLDFTKQELSELVRVAVEENTLTIEPVASQALPVVKVSAIECGGPNGFRAQIMTKCALSGLSRTCRHRIRLGDSENYYYISPSCRARITAVCNFFTYIRYIQQGLVRQDVHYPAPYLPHLKSPITHLENDKPGLAPDSRDLFSSPRMPHPINGTDLLGDHEAPEGDVPGQAGLLSE